MSIDYAGREAVVRWDEDDPPQMPPLPWPPREPGRWWYWRWMTAAGYTTAAHHVATRWHEPWGKRT